MNRPGLEVSDLTVAYGGHLALDGLHVSAPLGRITSLIGPNGAGKTTSFNACSGLISPTRGSVHLLGTDVTSWSPAQRARHGLGRTFQRIEVCEAMTVRENVALGLESKLAGSSPWRQVVASVSARRQVTEATSEAIARCGIDKISGSLVGGLSTGQRRLVELARALAGGFQLLLLDEPSSGLDENETAAFGDILTEVVSERGLGILLVEHDMPLVMSICSYIYVLDFGRPIFDGTPAEVQASPIVRSAYLGEDVA